jgi:hypothetical protein
MLVDPMTPMEAYVSTPIATAKMIICSRNRRSNLRWTAAQIAGTKLASPKVSAGSAIMIQPAMGVRRSAGPGGVGAMADGSDSGRWRIGAAASLTAMGVLIDSMVAASRPTSAVQRRSSRAIALYRVSARMLSGSSAGRGISAPSTSTGMTRVFGEASALSISTRTKSSLASIRR